MRHSFARWAIRIIAVVVLLVVAALGYRALRQHQVAEALAIRTPAGIEEVSFVRIGGIDQWVEIRGEDRGNPVLLVLHGGPGASETPLFSLFRSWEKQFTVVMWDQRGAGKTFAHNGLDQLNGVTNARMAEDGIELTNYLRKHLHKDKVILLGHSWGTMMGLMMVKAHPELFSAYVGTGQVNQIDEKEKYLYADTMKRLEAAHDKTGIAKLKSVGPPPYKSDRDLEVQRALSEKYDIPAERDLRANLTTTVLFAPGWSLYDIYEFLEAPKYTGPALYDEHLSYDAARVGTKIDVPFFVVNGADDAVTPTPLAREYFDRVVSPHKEFVVLKNAGHSAILTEPDIFLRELVTRVRPYATKTETPHG